MAHNHLVIMNTQSKVNPSKDLSANEYVADDYYEGVLIFQRGYQGGKGTFFAVPAEDLKNEEGALGGYAQSVTHDSGLGYRRAGEARLVGTVAKDGTKTGIVPTTQVQVYVFK